MKIIKPMEPILSDKSIKDKDWIHQIKWDGIRGLTYINNKKVKIFAKSGRERTDNYRELLMIPELIHADEAVFDGELVVLKDKKPSFEFVALREKVSREEKIKEYMIKYPVKYKVFDILSKDDKDLRSYPYLERKQILEKTLNANDYINIVSDYTDGEKLFKEMEENNFEGIVSKNINSIYLPGKKHKLWYKKKVNKKGLVVIGGLKYKNGFPSSLLVGVYQHNNLIYVGNVYSGLKQKDLEIFNLNIKKISQKKSPFINHKSKDEIIWLKPIITCYINYLEQTIEGSLRHAKLIGFSNEKPQEAKLEGEQ